jgi:DNA-binding NarL/FixJ family response regulator
MTVPSEPGVLIIDALPLRSLGFISTLNRLSHLRVRDPRKAPVTLHTPDEAGPWIDAHANCEMLIYIVGGARNANCDHLERIKALRALAPDMPLMILADGESREEIISTLNSGAQGFLYVGANAELALRALSFMLNGGSYFPSATRLKHTDPAQRHPAIDCIPAPSCVMNGDNGAAKNLEDAARNRSLTARQMAVLELLSRGDTNKVIARRLGMREGTVKVHVRQIMRKFGVTNRTELAVAFAKGRIAARCSPGCGDVDARIPGLGAGGNAVTLAELMT